MNPQWTTDITFYRLQNFPAGKTIEVTHKYRPVPRFFFKSSDEIAGAEMRKSFCPDNSFLNAAKAAQKTGALQGVELRYIIKTARNWSGPIGQFTLTIDKEDPKSLVSTCFTGLKNNRPDELRRDQGKLFSRRRSRRDAARRRQVTMRTAADAVAC